ncbi:MAG: ABC transporter ATP-binding protein [Bacteroidota bacterium]|nr:ABC transporter ATP-binding protein [Bacteroidota bacterium]
MLIEIENLSKFYQQFKAVDQLSMHVDEGDIYGFLGPNGSGKSTTIRMILGLIRPTSGTIRLFGEDTASGKNTPLKRIGALVEKPDFYNYLSARKNLEILGKLSEVTRLKKSVDEMLDIVGLGNRGHSKVRTYSQGMKQRLGIAQALLHNPDLVILDEPTNGLDPQGQKEIRELIIRLREERKITVLISSHLLFEMEHMATRMVIINKGKALVEGSVSELLRESEQQLTISFENPDETRSLISESQWSKQFVGHDQQKLFFRITRELVPDLTSFLVAKGSRITAVEPVRSLEDFFLQITENETTG